MMFFLVNHVFFLINNVVKFANFFFFNVIKFCSSESWWRRNHSKLESNKTFPAGTDSATRQSKSNYATRQQPSGQRVSQGLALQVQDLPAQDRLSNHRTPHDTRCLLHLLYRFLHCVLAWVLSCWEKTGKIVPTKMKFENRDHYVTLFGPTCQTGS